MEPPEPHVASEKEAKVAASEEPGEELQSHPRPPSPREAVARAHKVPRGRPNRLDFLRLDLAETRRPASPKVLAEVQGMRAEELACYPDPTPLVSALAVHHSVPMERVTVTAGADEAIRWAFNAYLEPGARVIIPRPTFGAFLSAAEAGGAFVERVDHDEDLEISIDQLSRVLSPRTPRMLCLANPNAPTGTALQNAEIVRLARQSPETLLLVNETFATFHGHSLLDGGAGATLPANILVLRSFSKDYGLAGMRVGYLVGHPEVIAAVDLARPSFTVSSVSLRAAVAALEDHSAMQAQVARQAEVQERLAAQLEKRAIEVFRTRTNFLLVRLASPIQPWAAAFAAHKVLVGTTGHSGPLAPYVRVTVNDDAEAKRFLDALDVILRMGVPGAARVRGVPGKWDNLESEGMA